MVPVDLDHALRLELQESTLHFVERDPGHLGDHVQGRGAIGVKEQESLANVEVRFFGAPMEGGRLRDGLGGERDRRRPRGAARRRARPSRRFVDRLGVPSRLQLRVAFACQEPSLHARGVARVGSLGKGLATPDRYALESREVDSGGPGLGPLRFEAPHAEPIRIGPPLDCGLGGSHRDQMKGVDIHQTVVGELERRNDWQAQERELEERLRQLAPNGPARGVKAFKGHA